MTDDEEFELCETIAAEVHLLVNKLTEGIPQVNDTEIRQQLTEQFRFWRQA
jgi:hypothetical protein